MKRLQQFVLEALAGLLAAGILVGIGIPLLALIGEPLSAGSRQALVWATAAICVAIATGRRGGSLRRG